MGWWDEGGEAWGGGGRGHTGWRGRLRLLLVGGVGDVDVGRVDREGVGEQALGPL